ncbi:Hypothetical_protein [Hexamita inflata]|uniref:Hypothetical_protein n=1 Tax=Hexamita inflata TaxID=28002 RepID=A0AA86UVR2_9EUKA|nr:Hypothetical protein HINF_LOCUS54226 [Hexamita inflata]
MLCLVTFVVNNICDDFDCNGFECKEYTLLNRTVPVCQCDQELFDAECQFCRNFMFTRESNCTECVYNYLDPMNACKSCITNPRLDPVQGCTQCVHDKYDIEYSCNKCKYQHMDFSKDCNSCEGNFILLVNECISKAFSNFSIYFGIIFSHLAIIAVLIMIKYQNKRENTINEMSFLI